MVLINREMPSPTDEEGISCHLANVAVGDGFGYPFENG